MKIFMLILLLAANVKAAENFGTYVAADEIPPGSKINVELWTYPGMHERGSDRKVVRFYSGKDKNGGSASESFNSYKQAGSKKSRDGSNFPVEGEEGAKNCAFHLKNTLKNIVDSAKKNDGAEEYRKALTITKVTTTKTGVVFQLADNPDVSLIECHGMRTAREIAEMTNTPKELLHVYRSNEKVSDRTGSKFRDPSLLPPGENSHYSKAKQAE